MELIAFVALYLALYNDKIFILKLNLKLCSDWPITNLSTVNNFTSEIHMSISISNTPSFAPANSGNGTILEVAVKAKELAEEEGRMALKLIESAGPSANPSSSVGNAGHNINIKA